MTTEPTLRPISPPSAGAADLALARLSLSQGKVVKAKAALQAAVAADPENGEAIRLLLAVNQAGASYGSAAWTTLRLHSRRVSQILFVVALFFLCGSLSYGVAAKKADTNGTVTVYRSGMGSRQMSRQEVLGYAAANLVPSLAAVGLGIYFFRARERFLQS